MNDTKIASKAKAQLAHFMGKVFTHFSKPSRKFVEVTLFIRARLIILRFVADIKAKKSSRDHFQPRMGWRKGPLRGVAAEIMV